jgi:hypothetical protein
VNINLIIKLLKSSTASSVGEAKEVLELKAQYPYCQAFHVLAAKVSKEHDLRSQQQELQSAAVYSCDRSVLKDIMTAQQPSEEEEIVADKAQHEPAENTSQTFSYTIQTETTDSVDIADTVLDDLLKLNILRQNFEILFADSTKVSHSVIKKSAKTSTDDDIAPKEASPKKSSSSKASAKSKKDRIIELAKSVNTGKVESSKQAVPERPAPKKKKKEASVDEELIEEIKTLKEELEPENDKQKEQIEIIDQFIKTQPSITSARERGSVSSGDLNSVKSGEYGDHIVSETLVDLLLKQGKKDKAIEVLKKLIWKYPQKKAYFASLIEDLKK